MSRKLRPARIGGRGADHWEFADDCFILRSKDRLIEVRVPVADLIDESKMDAHFDRLEAWAPDAALRELETLVVVARS